MPPRADHTAEEAHTRSHEILRRARDSSDDQDLRERIRDGYRSRYGGQEPYAWQLDVSEALMRGLDTTVIAGTGAGKTEPFIMPTLAGSTRTTVVISPLKNLEEDQQFRFEKLKVKVAVINAETAKSQRKLKKAIINDKPEVVLASPEISLCDGGAFREILGTPEFTKNIGMYVIDEAHCITQQGKDFRPLYRELDKLRALAPHAVPILAVSATMPIHVLADVRGVLQIDPRNSYHINLGNDRPNVAQEIRVMLNRQDYAALDYLVEGVERRDDLIRTIVYARTIHDVHQILTRLQSKIPTHLARNIDILHARRSERDRKDVVKRFRNGRIKILIATESAGMGLDVPDIVRIVHFDVPDDIEEWVQRAGRAARSRSIRGIATMVVPRSAFEVKGGKAKYPHENREEVGEEEASGEEGDGENGMVVELDKEDGEVQYRKKVDANVRAWIMTTGCRRDVLDEYYDNPPRSAPAGMCCDNCERADREAELDLHSLSERVRSTRDHCTPLTPSRLANSPRNDRDSITPSLKRRHASSPSSESSPTASPTKPKTRRRAGKHLANTKHDLDEWRRRTKKESYPYVPFMSSGILPDRNLKTVASRKDLNGVESLNSLRPRWPLAHVHSLGEEALDVVRRADEEESQRREKEVADEGRARKRRKVEERAEAERLNKVQWEEEARERERRIEGNLLSAFRAGRSSRASPSTSTAVTTSRPTAPSSVTALENSSAQMPSATRRYQTRAATRSAQNGVRR